MPSTPAPTNRLYLPGESSPVNVRETVGPLAPPVPTRNTGLRTSSSSSPDCSNTPVNMSKCAPAPASPRLCGIRPVEAVAKLPLKEYVTGDATVNSAMKADSPSKSAGGIHDNVLDAAPDQCI